MATPQPIESFPHVNWEEALNQVGEDRDFLKEVLGDLKSETEEAIKEIETAYKKYQSSKDDNNYSPKREFEEIRKAAHRIKGSASYLSCHRLREVSLRMQDTGHQGEVSNSVEEQAQLASKIGTLFTQFRAALADLEVEIDKFFK